MTFPNNQTKMLWRNIKFRLDITLTNAEPINFSICQQKVNKEMDTKCDFLIIFAPFLCFINYNIITLITSL